MRKMIILLSIIGLLSFTLPALAAYDYNVDVFVNGSRVSFPDQKPFLDTEKGRTYVPLRFVSQALGAHVTWDEAGQRAIVMGDVDGVTRWIYMPINSTEAVIDSRDGTRNVTIDAPALLLNGRTMVPFRFAAESLGAKAEWKGPEATGTGRGRVEITKQEAKKEEPKTGGLLPGHKDAKGTSQPIQIVD
ncbi:MAG: copper amine oxidase N-terminal domain-containing protein [Firmicutes bacterium]|nr:copper amine oxidase N-terminal domain-containing protein [Bacillota bacterium]